MGAQDWRITLAHWQNWQSLDQQVMSVDMPVHTHLADIRHLVALMPRWASVWIAVNLHTGTVAATGGCSCREVADELAATSRHDSWAATALICPHWR